MKILSNEKNNLDLFCDDVKTLRLKGHFGNYSLVDDHEHPVLLRTFLYFTNLLI